MGRASCSATGGWPLIREAFDVETLDALTALG
jgi:hypothetical protein